MSAPKPLNRSSAKMFTELHIIPPPKKRVKLSEISPSTSTPEVRLFDAAAEFELCRPAPPPTPTGLSCTHAIGARDDLLFLENNMPPIEYEKVIKVPRKKPRLGYFKTPSRPFDAVAEFELSRPKTPTIPTGLSSTHAIGAGDDPLFLENNMPPIDDILAMSADNVEYELAKPTPINVINPPDVDKFVTLTFNDADVLPVLDIKPADLNAVELPPVAEVPVAKHRSRFATEDCMYASRVPHWN